MVRKLPLPVLLLIAVLTATVVGCSFFAASTFPAYLTQVSAFVDLSKEMDGFIGSAGEDFECRLYVLKNSSGREYIFVGIHVFSIDKRKAIILDNSLKVRKEQEHPDLGDLHMVDANGDGDFLIGNVLFDKDDLTLIASPGVDPYRRGFSAGGQNFIIWIDSGIPHQLAYQQYGAGWIPGGMQTPLIEAAGVFYLENTGYSADRNEVALFLQRQGDDFCQVVLIPDTHFGPGLNEPIIGSYPVFPVDSANHGNYHYTNDGIVVNTDHGVAKLYGFDGQVKAEFPIGDDPDAVESYDTEGSYYYHLDVRGRRLYKCETWW